MVGKEFNYKNVNLSHPGKRYQGQFIDGLISILLFFILVYLKNLAGINNNITGIISFAIPFAYFVFSDALPNGQSIGKLILGMSVVSKSTGKSCTVIQSFFRNVFSPIFGTIDAILVFTEKRQRLGDKLANTIVIDI